MLPWAECMCSSWVKAEPKVRHVLVICCTSCCCPLTSSCQPFLGLLLVAIVTVQLIGLSCHCTHGNVSNACSEVLPGFTAPLQYESLWGYPNRPPDLKVSLLLQRRKAQFSLVKTCRLAKVWIWAFLGLKYTMMRVDKLDKVEINPLLCCVGSPSTTLFPPIFLSLPAWHYKIIHFKWLRHWKNNSMTAWSCRSLTLRGFYIWHKWL